MSNQAINPASLSVITVIVINYRTRDLTERCVTSLHLYYPDINLLLVDNGSGDDSTEFIREYGAMHQNTQVFLYPKNLFHGPALHHAIQDSSTPLVFLLDSDCQVLKAGFIEGMLASFKDPLLYATGRLVQMNQFGYEQEKNKPGTQPYIHPSAMLLDRSKYLNLKPFIHHGSPALQNMRIAVRAGWRVQNYPLDGFIYHQGRGTCSRFGYGLGWRHLLEYFLNKLSG